MDHSPSPRSSRAERRVRVASANSEHRRAPAQISDSKFQTATTSLRAKRSNPDSNHGAKQMDCFVATLLATTRQLRHASAFPRRECARAKAGICPSKKQGRRKRRVPAAPAASRAKVIEHTSNSPQVHRSNPAFPAQWFYGLFRALPGDRALLPPSSAKDSANLTPASGRQDHTALPSADQRLRLWHRPRPPHPAPRS
jgi:hypothetical protein